MPEDDLMKAYGEAADNVLLPLRMLKGLDREAVAELIRIVDRCTEKYAGSKEIPKDLALEFFDTYPAMVSASYLYKENQIAEIQEQAEHFADHVRSCLLS